MEIIFLPMPVAWGVFLPSPPTGNQKNKTFGAVAQVQMVSHIQDKSAFLLLPCRMLQCPRNALQASLWRLTATGTSNLSVFLFE
jgi:hypothetical protein